LFQVRYPAENIKVGLICVLHTGGKDLKFNVHIHAIVTEGGLNETNEWKSYTYFPFAQLRGIWKYEVLTGLKTDFDPMNSLDPQQFYGIIENLFLASCTRASNRWAFLIKMIRRAPVLFRHDVVVGFVSGNSTEAHPSLVAVT